MNEHHEVDEVCAAIAALDQPCYIVRAGSRVVATTEFRGDSTLLAAASPLPPHRLGSQAFTRHHGVSYPYMAGAMAGAISSTDLVATLARAGYLASFGAAGLTPDRLDGALTKLRAQLGDLPYASNLIHTPRAPHWERAAVDLYLRHRVRCVEASAFMGLTPEVVRYRVAGLRTDPRTGVHAENRMIAKVSRPEVAAPFMRPPPAPLVADLLAAGLVTTEQAALARLVPMADDITAEADSAGHSDRRPLAMLVPQMLRLRDEVARDQGYPTDRVRVGAAGCIGTPQAALAAFTLGAAYVVTGSINQACVEAGTSEAAKQLLAAADPADCVMAPAADMFEMGVEVQVLRRGTRFPAQAAYLHRLYRTYDSIEALPDSELHRLNTHIFRRDMEQVWAETVDYLRRHHPSELEQANSDSKRRMALLFRWYLGMTSRWATIGEADRVEDFQIWCGPAMGAFNTWVRGTQLEALPARRAADIADHILRGAAFHARIAQLRFAGVRIPAACAEYPLPRPLPRRPAEGSGLAQRAGAVGEAAKFRSR